MILCGVTGGAALIWSVGIASLLSLALLGSLAAHVGGASKARGALRVTVWGCLAMGVTLLIGHFCSAMAT